MLGDKQLCFNLRQVHPVPDMSTAQVDAVDALRVLAGQPHLHMDGTNAISDPPARVNSWFGQLLAFASIALFLF